MITFACETHDEVMDTADVVATETATYTTGLIRLTCDTRCPKHNPDPPWWARLTEAATIIGVPVEDLAARYGITLDTRPACTSTDRGGNCVRPAQPEHTPCCSSHARPMCCEHYCRAHHVEVHQCNPATHMPTIGV